MAEQKTNVMRVLDQKKIRYLAHEYPHGDAPVDGETVASLIGKDADCVYKTLVTRGSSKKIYVFVVPVKKELDLKLAAKAAGEKKIEMIKDRELLPLTGYVHGGCSPIGMKKRFPTFIDETALMFDFISVSAGQRGVQVLLDPEDLIRVTGALARDIIKY